MVGKEEELIIFKGLYSPNFVCAKFASLDNKALMTFIDLASLGCGRYEGGENPYSLVAALCAEVPFI